jgi:Predicted membrane protein
MDRSQKILIIYFVTINVATFLTYGIDKWKAKHSKMRIREAALLTLAVLGGSIGALLGMQVWHHKTQHKKFKYGLPLILLAQIVLIYLINK